MSKKHKKKKNLIKAQIQANQSSLSKGSGLSDVKQVENLSEIKEKHFDKKELYTPKIEENIESIAIKKDIRFTTVLVIIVLIFFALIYYIDLKNQTLIQYANEIFKLVQ